MYPVLNNTQPGMRGFLSDADLTGLEGTLVKVVAGTGNVPRIAQSGAITDHLPFVLLEGATVGRTNFVEPFTGEKNLRARLKSTCVPGDLMVQAATGTAADKGKLRKLPATTGTYIVVAVAEEAGADGGLVLVRPYGPFPVTV